MKTFGKDVSTYKRYAEDLNKGVYPDLSCIPDYLSGYVKLMLRANPAARPNLYDVSKVRAVHSHFMFLSQHLLALI